MSSFVAPDHPEAITAMPFEEVLQASSVVLKARLDVADASEAYKAAKLRLAEAEEGLAEVLGGLARSGKASPPSSEAQEAAADDATFREKILTLVNGSPHDIFTPAKIAPAIGSSNTDSVRTMLSELAARAKITRVGVGQYTAVKKESAM